MGALGMKSSVRHPVFGDHVAYRGLQRQTNVQNTNNYNVFYSGEMGRNGEKNPRNMKMEYMTPKQNESQPELPEFMKYPKIPTVPPKHVHHRRSRLCCIASMISQYSVQSQCQHDYVVSATMKARAPDNLNSTNQILKPV